MVDFTNAVTEVEALPQQVVQPGVERQPLTVGRPSVGGDGI
jgi:hypothetical protein